MPAFPWPLYATYVMLGMRCDDRCAVGVLYAQFEVWGSDTWFLTSLEVNPLVANYETI